MIMIAMRHAERSYSHWGIFIVPDERVRIEHMDCGRQLDDSFLSQFFIGDMIHKSAWHGPGGGEERLAHDYSELEKLGIDTSTIRYE